MSTTLKILPVKCGDAFVIQQEAEDQKVRHLLVDGGFMNSYGQLYDQLKRIKKKKVFVDLWVLTHLDADHINGAVRFFREEAGSKLGKRVRRLWFNFFDAFTVNDDSPFLSFTRGFDLSKILRKEKVKGRQDITNDLKPVEFGDAKLTLLSPDQETYDKLKKHWKKEFKKYYGAEPPTAIADTTLKDVQTIEKLSKKSNARDNRSKNGLVNRSSIAFIYEEDGRRVLLMGDAYPSVIIKALTADYSKKKPLELKYLKLAHHGSRNNYHSDLLDIIRCRRFIISADGENQHGLPDKEVLAKILTHPNRDHRKKIIFYFNHDDNRLRELFSVDKDAGVRYNFECKFPKPGKVLSLKL